MIAGVALLTIKVPVLVGPTAEHNLFALCRHHHRLKHHTGWRVEIDDDGTVTWISPTGHHYKTRPPDAS